MKLNIFSLIAILSLSSVSFGEIYKCSVKLNQDIKCGGKNYGNNLITVTINTEDPRFKDECRVFGGSMLIGGGLGDYDINKPCSMRMGPSIYPQFKLIVNVTTDGILQLITKSSVMVIQPYMNEGPVIQSMNSAPLGVASLSVSHVEQLWGKVKTDLTCVKQ